MALKRDGFTSQPECYVTRTGVSPMNPKVKWAELNCGHTVWRNRKPKIGAKIVCWDCARKVGDPK